MNQTDMENNSIPLNTTATVVIGRNEGERLHKCLISLPKELTVIYVDSGSTDNSLEYARKYATKTVRLDMSLSFTAARARNAGAECALMHFPQVEFIQFIDGDCEVGPSWITTAVDFLHKNHDYAVVCGRRRERFPEASVYNQLCDIEWNTPVGEAASCGGDALIRVDAFRQVDGYRNDLIAGEEPEMCFRMRQLGWKVMRLDAEMTMHDAAMSRFSQWWKRAKRAGYAYAASFHLHGSVSHEQFRKKETRSIVLWAAVLPVLFSLLSSANPVFLVLFLLYPLQILRLYKRYRSDSFNQRNAAIYALSNVFGKFPQFSGCLQFLLTEFRGQKATIIEYK